MFYFIKRTAQGKWRLYSNVSQATTSWRGSNDKVSVIRDGAGRIVERNTEDEIRAYCKATYNTNPFLGDGKYT